MAGASIEAIRNNPENAMLKLQVGRTFGLCGGWPRGLISPSVEAHQKAVALCTGDYVATNGLLENRLALEATCHSQAGHGTAVSACVGGAAQIGDLYSVVRARHHPAFV
jgi:hypothetical protein